METRMRLGKGLFLLLGVGFLPACGQEANDISSTEPHEVLMQPQLISNEDCLPGEGIRYVCGLENAEDALLLGDTDWVVVSGMNGDLVGSDANGKIHLVNSVSHSIEMAFPGSNPVLELDSLNYGVCPGPIDVGNFSAHGLALRENESGGFQLYMTSHGAREAVEIFDIDIAQDIPEIKWVGCVPMPSTAWINSVVILQDGGLMTTVFMSPPESGIEDVLAGEITGNVLEWHPGGEVLPILGTELSGANGIEIDDEENAIYVAEFGQQQVVRFDLTTSPVTKSTVTLGVQPDNVRWTPHGTLITAGANVAEYCEDEGCEGGWSVFEIDPARMTAQRLAGVDEGSRLAAASSALLVGDELWVGTYQGDSIGIIDLP